MYKVFLFLFFFSFGFYLIFTFFFRQHGLHPYIRMFFPFGLGDGVCEFYLHFLADSAVRHFDANGSDTSTVQAEHTTDQQDATVSSVQCC